jgi:hypothetical protein
VTHHIVISSTLSAVAREALADLLSSVSTAHDLLDLEQGEWTIEDARSVARELAAAGYGHLTASGDLMWDIVPQVATQLPSDHLDELTPALEAIDQVVQQVDSVRTPENPDPDHGLRLTWPVLLQLQNVLRIATYAQRGILRSTDVNSQLPAVAMLLGRAIRQQIR